MDKPNIAGEGPVEIELEKDKTYFFCTCGLSSTQPFCDGSHKGTSFKSFAFTPDKDGKAWLCMCKHTAKQPFCDGTHNKVCS